jgi:hypothetical protein
MAVDFLEPFFEWLLPREVLELLEDVGGERLPAAGGALPQCPMDGFRHVTYL